MTILWSAVMDSVNRKPALTLVVSRHQDHSGVRVRSTRQQTISSAGFFASSSAPKAATRLLSSTIGDRSSRCRMHWMV